MTTICPICSSAASPAFKSDFASIWQCQNRQCGHLFAPDVEDNQGVMEDATPESRATNFQKRNERLISSWKRRGWIRQDSRVLDFGAGVGHIDDSMRALLPDADLTCMEASEPLAQSLEARKFRTFRDLSELPAGDRFDFIILVEVIEHVKDPVRLLRDLHERLASSGSLFLTTPCGEKRSGSRRTTAYKTRFHIQFFTEKSLKLALEKAGFRKTGFHYFPAMYPPLAGIPGIVQKLKQIIKSILVRMEGYSHLVCLAK